MRAAGAWLVVGVVFLAGCTVAGEQGDESVLGQVSAAVTNVPSDVMCLHIVIGGTGKNFSLTAGASSANVSFGPVPAGWTYVTADAFSVACPTGDVAPTASATWSAEPVSTEIRGGLPTTIPLVLRQRPAASASVDFRMSATSIAVGAAEAYAVVGDGTVRMWGMDATNVLGGGAWAKQPKPKQIPGLTGVSSVAAGSYFACAVLSGGTVKCWGVNSNGQLGNGTTTDASSPTLVSGLSDVRAVRAGNSHACALLNDGRVKCWGSGSYGQFGVTSGIAVTPVDAYPSAIEITAGAFHTCIVTPAREMLCTGANDLGQLGTGSTTGGAAWRWVVSGTATQSIFAGNHTTCRVRADGTTQCWGSNGSAQFGYGTTTYSVTTPATLSHYAGARQIALVANGALCVAIAGSVSCSGSNYGGILGDGTGIDSMYPVAVPDLTNVVELKAGGPVCARTETGDVYCWGPNAYGQLGDGTLTHQYKPVRVTL